MIIFGVMTETSVGQLYMAGILPGILLALLFAAYIIVYAMLYPGRAPRGDDASVPLREKLRSLVEVAPIALLIVVVLAHVFGIVTHRGGRARGRQLARGHGGHLRWGSGAFHETVRTTSFIMLIIIFASIFSHVIALLGAPKALLGLVTGLNLAPWMVFALIFALLVAIAYALEELSVMIIMLPILFPLVTGLGFDPVWFWDRDGRIRDGHPPWGSTCSSSRGSAAACATSRSA
jgi:TRAP-type C4-dicarboxylate transport system permease large subunit